MSAMRRRTSTQCRVEYAHFRLKSKNFEHKVIEEDKHKTKLKKPYVEEAQYDKGLHKPQSTSLAIH